MKIVSFFYAVLILSNYVTTQYQCIEIWKRISKKMFYSLQVLYYKQELRKFRLESSGFSRMAMKKNMSIQGDFISFYLVTSEAVRPALENNTSKKIPQIFQKNTRGHVFLVKLLARH